jgi:hypothetical protein
MVRTMMRASISFYSLGAAFPNRMLGLGRDTYSGVVRVSTAMSKVQCFTSYLPLWGGDRSK